MTAFLEARSLTKRYGSILALDSVDFEVGEGITGLLGPNGAGKSTAIKLSLGLIRPTSGSAEVMGRRPYDSPGVRERLGYMPEHDCLPPAASAAEFLSHMAQVSGLPPAQARTRAADILRHVGLEEERYRPMGQYSTGMKQRVKLGQALVHDPVLVLLDEPTAGLDPAGREDMLRLVRRTGREFGISIILSSHLMNDVESTCDRIIVLEGGRVTEQRDGRRIHRRYRGDRPRRLRQAGGGRHRAGRQGNKRDPGGAVHDSGFAVRGPVRRHTGRGGGNGRAPAPDEPAPPPARRNLPGGPMTGPPMTPQPGRQTGAEVFDLGYRHYEGLREGRARARRAIYVNGLRTTLGLGRGTMAKVLAILMFGAAMVPAVIMAVVASLLEPLADTLPSHADYYELVSLVLFLFAAIIGPELLCPDRRDGVINLYLVRPITPTDYVAARWLALVYGDHRPRIFGAAGALDRTGAVRIRSRGVPPPELAGHSAHPGRWAGDCRVPGHGAAGGGSVHRPAGVRRRLRDWPVHHQRHGFRSAHRLYRIGQIRPVRATSHGRSGEVAVTGQRGRGAHQGQRHHIRQRRLRSWQRRNPRFRRAPASGAGALVRPADLRPRGPALETLREDSRLSTPGHR